MIADALDYLRTRLRDSLSLADDEVVLAGTGALAPTGAAGLLLTLMDTELSQVRVAPVGGPLSLGPEAFVMRLLVASRFPSYAASLIRLEQAIRFGAATPVLDGDSLPAGIARITLAAIPLTLDDTAALWSAVGQPLLPFVLWRVTALGTAH